MAAAKESLCSDRKEGIRTFRQEQSGLAAKRGSGERLRLSREVLLTDISVFLTLIVTCMLFREIFSLAAKHVHETDYRHAVQQIVFAAVVAFFIYGNVLYQLTRLGYLKRLKAHLPASREELEGIYDGPAPDLAILIPSYKEEARVVKQALLSAALQEYPNRRVVLLIDDPPTPGSAEDLYGLLTVRRLPGEVKRFLEGPEAMLDNELADFIIRRSTELTISDECLRLAGLYRRVAIWFEKQAYTHPVNDHTDRWFVEKIFREPARSHFRRAAELTTISQLEGCTVDECKLEREYRRLAALFKVDLSSFERKRCRNLSHEPNKAMNLNSYIGLLGKPYRETKRNGKTYLESCKLEECAFLFPDADYLITLDADSLLLPEYALRLIHIMDQPGNERLAVVQTPYSAVPHAPGLVERIAGATTDLQYIIHQGFTKYSATYWVGANALLRRSALEDISTVVEEHGNKITKYIQDRTVIEDTESSIDLIDRGWKLHNYPERLSYSATPPDFGSLLIQRRRWANGGLIILPKLLRHLFSGSNFFKKGGEGFMRFHYLTSITGVNIGLMLMLVLPFEENLRSIWLPLTAVPYFFLYGRDLVQSGYKIGDLPRVYALNLLLMPVNLGGVLKSIHQALTGKKIPFGRTPKVTNRTAVPSLYIISEIGILLYCFINSFVDTVSGRWLHAFFALMNGVIFLYAIIRYMGLKESAKDLADWWITGRFHTVLLTASENRSLKNFFAKFRVIFPILVMLIIILIERLHIMGSHPH